MHELKVYNNFNYFPSNNFDMGSRREVCWNREVGGSDEGIGKFELKQFISKYIEEI